MSHCKICGVEVSLNLKLCHRHAHEETEKRLAKLEENTHPAFNFSPLVKRIEALENNQRAAVKTHIDSPIPDKDLFNTVLLMSDVYYSTRAKAALDEIERRLAAARGT